MRNLLRECRTPSEWAASGQVIEIDEKIGDIERLVEIVRHDVETLNPDNFPVNWREAPVTGRLSFGFADAQARVPALEGYVAATVDAVCQRCLQPFRLRLEMELKLLFAGGQDDFVDAGGYEVWELEKDRLKPLDIVEEVLVMTMPLAALHVDEAACKSPQGEGPGEASTTRPFASLREQMENDN